MFALISPAKKLDFCGLDRDLPHSQPVFLDETEKLLAKTRKLSARKLKDLMSLSDSLAELNAERFQQLQVPARPETGKQAALAFAGDTYVGLDANSLTADELDFAQGHLGILSGFYGLLRPMDLIEPYRLEMGTRLKTRRGPDLYAFWGDRIQKVVEDRLGGDDDAVIVNLASQEYFKAIRPRDLQARVITPGFYEMRDGQPKMISFTAKKARGMMARYIIQNRIVEPEQLKNFDVDGYAFDPGRSEGDRWAYIRG